MQDELDDIFEVALRHRQPNRVVLVVLALAAFVVVTSIGGALARSHNELITKEVSRSINIVPAITQDVSADMFEDVGGEAVPNYMLVSALTYQEQLEQQDVGAGHLIETVVLPIGIDTSSAGQKDDTPSVINRWVSPPTFTETTGSVGYGDVKQFLYTGSKISTLTVPRLGIDGAVVRYGGQPQIDAGLCLWDSFDIPGANGVSLLAAHNYNPIWKIGNLKTGDRLYMDTTYGEFVYEVYNAFVNTDGRTTYWMKEAYFDANNKDLVLMTCYPFDADGSDGRRYIVQCRLVEGTTVSSAPKSRLERYSGFEDYLDSVGV